MCLRPPTHVPPARASQAPHHSHACWPPQLRARTLDRPHVPTGGHARGAASDIPLITRPRLLSCLSPPCASRSEYMLAQRVKKELFETEADYLGALAAHHSLMQAAMKTKQVVDVAACDALDHAIGDVGAMYTKK